MSDFYNFNTTKRVKLIDNERKKNLEDAFLEYLLIFDPTQILYHREVKLKIKPK